MKKDDRPKKTISIPTVVGILVTLTLAVLLAAGIMVMRAIIPLTENLQLALRTGLDPQVAVQGLMRGVVLRLVVGVGSAVALQLVLIFFGVRMLLRRIGTLEPLGAGLAEGDLTISSSLRSRDAIGRLARSINVAVHNLNGIAVHILHAVRASNHSATELTQKVEDALSGSGRIGDNARVIRSQMQELTDQLGGASGAVEQILASISSLGDQINNQSAQVEQTSAAVNEMGASIDSVARIANERRQQVGRLVETTREGGDQVQETQEVMQSVHDGIDAITEVVGVIDQIAGQTNLLAMNAAIEAAHAGEAGKGFAVVSDEIRRLAESTSENSRSISSSLMETVDKIETALTSSQSAGKSFDEVQSEVSLVADAFNEIASSTEELSVGGGEMVRSIQELATVTDAIREGTREMQTGAENATEALQSIRGISQQATEGISGITGEVDGILSAVNAIAAVNNKNQANMERLNSEITTLRVDEQAVSAATDVDDILDNIEEF